MRSLNSNELYTRDLDPITEESEDPAVSPAGESVGGSASLNEQTSSTSKHKKPEEPHDGGNGSPNDKLGESRQAKASPVAEGASGPSANPPESKTPRVGGGDSTSTTATASAATSSGLSEDNAARLIQQRARARLEESRQAKASPVAEGASGSSANPPESKTPRVGGGDSTSTTATASAATSSGLSEDNAARLIQQRARARLEESRQAKASPVAEGASGSSANPPESKTPRVGGGDSTSTTATASAATSSGLSEDNAARLIQQRARARLEESRQAKASPVAEGASGSSANPPESKTPRVGGGDSTSTTATASAATSSGLSEDNAARLIQQRARARLEESRQAKASPVAEGASGSSANPPESKTPRVGGGDSTSTTATASAATSSGLSEDNAARLIQQRARARLEESRQAKASPVAEGASGSSTAAVGSMTPRVGGGDSTSTTATASAATSSGLSEDNAARLIQQRARARLEESRQAKASPVAEGASGSSANPPESKTPRVGGGDSTSTTATASAATSSGLSEDNAARLIQQRARARLEESRQAKASPVAEGASGSSANPPESKTPRVGGGDSTSTTATASAATSSGLSEDNAARLIQQRARARLEESRQAKASPVAEGASGSSANPPESKTPRVGGGDSTSTTATASAATSSGLSEDNAARLIQQRARARLEESRQAKASPVAEGASGSSANPPESKTPRVGGGDSTSTTATASAATSSGLSEDNAARLIQQRARARLEESRQAKASPVAEGASGSSANPPESKTPRVGGGDSTSTTATASAATSSGLSEDNAARLIQQRARARLEESRQAKASPVAEGASGSSANPPESKTPRVGGGDSTSTTATASAATSSGLSEDNAARLIQQRARARLEESRQAKASPVAEGASGSSANPPESKTPRVGGGDSTSTTATASAATSSGLSEDNAARLIQQRARARLEESRQAKASPVAEGASGSSANPPESKTPRVGGGDSTSTTATASAATSSGLSEDNAARLIQQRARARLEESRQAKASPVAEGASGSSTAAVGSMTPRVGGGDSTSTTATASAATSSGLSEDNAARLIQQRARARLEESRQAKASPVAEGASGSSANPPESKTPRVGGGDSTSATATASAATSSGLSEDNAARLIQQRARARLEESRQAKASPVAEGASGSSTAAVGSMTPRVGGGDSTSATAAASAATSSGLSEDNAARVRLEGPTPVPFPAETLDSAQPVTTNSPATEVQDTSETAAIQAQVSDPKIEERDASHEEKPKEFRRSGRKTNWAAVRAFAKGHMSPFALAALKRKQRQRMEVELANMRQEEERMRRLDKLLKKLERQTVHPNLASPESVSQPSTAPARSPKTPSLSPTGTSTPHFRKDTASHFEESPAETAEVENGQIGLERDMNIPLSTPTAKVAPASPRGSGMSGATHLLRMLGKSQRIKKKKRREALAQRLLNTSAPSPQGEAGSHNSPHLFHSMVRIKEGPDVGSVGKVIGHDGMDIVVKCADGIKIVPNKYLERAPPGSPPPPSLSAHKRSSDAPNGIETETNPNSKMEEPKGNPGNLSSTRGASLTSVSRRGSIAGDSVLELSISSEEEEPATESSAPVRLTPKPPAGHPVHPSPRLSTTPTRDINKDVAGQRIGFTSREEPNLAWNQGRLGESSPTPSSIPNLSIPSPHLFSPLAQQGPQELPTNTSISVDQRYALVLIDGEYRLVRLAAPPNSSAVVSVSGPSQDPSQLDVLETKVERSSLRKPVTRANRTHRSGSKKARKQRKKRLQKQRHSRSTSPRKKNRELSEPHRNFLRSGEGHGGAPTAQFKYNAADELELEALALLQEARYARWLGTRGRFAEFVRHSLSPHSASARGYFHSPVKLSHTVPNGSLGLSPSGPEWRIEQLQQCYGASSASKFPRPKTAGGKRDPQPRTRRASPAQGSERHHDAFRLSPIPPARPSTARQQHGSRFRSKQMPAWVN